MTNLKNCNRTAKDVLLTHTLKWYSHCAEFLIYEATNMPEKASRLRLVLRIHRANPPSHNENL